jgi:DNA-directed RNA polymerase specialized sigma24 family protein
MTQSEDSLAATSTFELLRQMVAGDRLAGDRLCERINTLLLATARRHGLRSELPPHVEVEDVVNEVWRSVLGERGLAVFEDSEEGALRAFMLNALDCRMIDAARRANAEPLDRTQADEFEDGPDPRRDPTSKAPTPTSDLRAADLLEFVRRVIGEREMKLVEGRAEGRRAREMAEQLGMNEEAAQRALSRATERLRILIKDI